MIEVTLFKAHDGTLFETKEKCYSYENDKLESARKSFKSIVDFTNYGIANDLQIDIEYDDIAYIVTPQTQTDIEIIRAYSYLINNGDELTPISYDLIGKKLICIEGDDYFYYTTLQELAKKFMKQLREATEEERE